MPSSILHFRVHGQAIARSDFHGRRPMLHHCHEVARRRRFNSFFCRGANVADRAEDPAPLLGYLLIRRTRQRLDSSARSPANIICVRIDEPRQQRARGTDLGYVFARQTGKAVIGPAPTIVPPRHNTPASAITPGRSLPVRSAHVHRGPQPLPGPRIFLMKRSRIHEDTKTPQELQPRGGLITAGGPIPAR